MWESLVVVVSVEVNVVQVVSSVLSSIVQVVQSAMVESSDSFRVSNNVLEVKRVSLDEIVSLVKLDDELIKFNEVVTVVVELLFVVNASSQEDSDNTVLVLV